ncbi:MULTISPECIES: ABC transporter ATP-binding protein [unclassified Enterococcus]|uniref:ABC transporter ATP-binding protein n=1 Tax=unclassified Enterococcus TaxID=2608891 RepID=UPI001CE15C2B|nr:MULTISPECIES: ABC transporter ATP-binding protein [unclassified Enterococcus]MCA5013904.1 ABC transporter ATP-binding protein [Enterococcus sp. S23]MCA5017322.1 ABC transporter ATP-binding protein [Enterococcus sp. S22(2020)]
MELNVKDLAITIGQEQIVKSVSLQTQKDQIVGIIGANGCGKSTMLKGIYKGIKPQAGTVFLDDLDLLAASEKKVAQRLGVVNQFNELNFDLTVFQMVLLGRTPHKKLLESDTPEDIEIVNDALAKTNLTNYVDRSFLSLSGGEKQRVILARTIAQQPKYMILDEPTNHLDIRYQLEILTCVKNLGIGVLAALHDLELAAHYCDYIYAMKAGKIIAEGKPEELFTAALIEEIYEVKCTIYTNPITKRLGFNYSLD